MNRTLICAGFGFPFFLGLGVPGMRAQQPAVAEPQAPSSSVQAPREVVPALPVPRLVKFAGTLNEEHGKPRTGVVGVTFAVYKEQEGGAALWLETQNVQLDEQGHYTVLLGATKGEGLPLELFSAGEPRWLGVQVNLPKEVEQPRVLLVSVPYALKAVDAETLSGLPASAFALAAPSGAVSGASGSGTSAQTSTKSKTAGKTATGASVPAMTNFIPVFLDDTGTSLGSSPMFQSGANIGLGTTTPAATLDVQLTTAGATNAVNSTITLNNSTPITGSVLSAFKMTLLDKSTAANLSKQPARFVYLRDASATGGVTAFDSVMTATSFLSANAPYPLRGVNIEGPTMATGKTLGNFTGLYIGSPGGAGTVSNKFALVTEPNAGNVGIGTTTPAATLDVNGNLNLPNTASATVGVISLGGVPFVHNFPGSSANTFVGEGAGNFTTIIGAGNTVVGGCAMFSDTTGNGNTAIGTSALTNNTTGANNIAIGSSAGINTKTGSNNIYIGNPGGVATESSTIRIGTPGTQTATFIQGIAGVPVISAVPVQIDTTTGQLGFVAISSQRFKENIQDLGNASNRLLGLRPVSFRYKNPAGSGPKPLQYGLIAEEVAKVYPELVVYGSDGQPEGVSYHLLPVLLLNELQKQQRHIQRLAKENRQLRKARQAVAQLEARLAHLESQQKATPAVVSMDKAQDRSTHRSTGSNPNQGQ